ncbi:MAG: maleylpyruvate isomerase N-terminal domain-containing protein [Actinomycetota bacterium]|nr:maleylpyruvate isomerase N-terminal domain-containing protein [Actinomycetota bacterium]
MRPIEDLQRVSDAQQRFLRAMDDLSDATVAAPSLLPGWTVGHVLAHVARNADSHVRRTEAAVRGEMVDQYPGGLPGRADEIDRTARGTARQLRDDVARSAETLASTWQETPDEAWSQVTRDVGGRERPLHRLPSRRWQELEVHVVDLGTSITHRDWPAEFVDDWLPRLRLDLAGRLPPRVDPPEPGVLDGRDELAWLYGRLQRPDLPVLVPWA